MFSEKELTAMFSTTTKKSPKRAPTPDDDPSSDEEGEEPEDKDPFGSFGIRSSCTARSKDPQRPQGTEDDPFTFADLPDEDKDDKGRRLKGIHPDKYNGDRSQTTRFLNTFNRFMLMNYKANSAKDPIMRSIYFLLLMEGPKCEGWVDMADKWMQLVAHDPSIIP